MNDGVWIISMSAIATVFIVGWIEIVRALRRPLAPRRPPVVE